MKVKTSELSGSALDLMVAICEGEEFYPTTDPDRYNVEKGVTHNFNPSVDWAQGGPFIAREKISIAHDHDIWNASITDQSAYYQGETPLEAAMRCYVASKLGVEVEVPNELINK